MIANNRRKHLQQGFIVINRAPFFTQFFLPQSHQVLRQFRGLSGEILHYFQPVIPCGEPPGAEAQFQEVHVFLIFLVFLVPSRGHVQMDHDPVRANQVETSRPVYQRRIADELTYFFVVELRIDLVRGNLPFPGNLMESLHKRAVVSLPGKIHTCQQITGDKPF